LLPLLFLNSADAIEPNKLEIEQQPLSPLPASISGKETVRDQINKWLRKNNLSFL
jgi:hypothetical protein